MVKQGPLSSHIVSVHLQRVDATHHPPSSRKGGIAGACRKDFFCDPWGGTQDYYHPC
ncbi:unnamed protein product, partial [Ectocarpus sp. 8 AP-2014]